MIDKKTKQKTLKMYVDQKESCSPKSDRGIQILIGEFGEI